MRRAAGYDSSVIQVLAALALIVVTALEQGSSLGAESAATKATILRALDFCGRAGAALPPGTQAIMLPEDKRWPGTVGVRFGDGVSMRIEPASGRIVTFVDTRVLPGPDALVERQEAIELANEYIAAAGGLPGPAVLEEITLQRWTPDTAIWTLYWRRHNAGYPDSLDGAHVHLAADSRRLVLLGMRFYSQPPASPGLNIGREEAIALARRYAGSTAPLLDARLMLAHPEQYDGVMDEASETQVNLRSTLAWFVYFDGERVTDVVLSAADGALLATSAGQQPASSVSANRRVTSASTDDPVAGVFAGATRVELLQACWSHSAHKVLAVWTLPGDAYRLACLASLVSAGAGCEVPCGASYLVRVTGRDGSVSTFAYFPDARVLTKGLLSRKVSARVDPRFDALLRGAPPTPTELSR